MDLDGNVDKNLPHDTTPSVVSSGINHKVYNISRGSTYILASNSLFLYPGAKCHILTLRRQFQVSVVVVILVERGR